MVRFVVEVTFSTVLSVVLLGCSLVIRVPSTLNSTLSNNCGAITAATGSVTPIYPLHANWNDYVHAITAPTSSPYNQADTDCLGTEQGYFGCVHGGEKRKVIVTGQSSCLGLQAQDNLGEFAWTCDASQNPVAFYTWKLNFGKGLRDVINPATLQFYPLGVTVTDKNNCPVLTVPPGVQWNNPIVDLYATNYNPAAMVNLAPAGPVGTIYALKTGTATLTAGYTFSSNKSALVMLGNSSLQWAGVSSNFCSGRDDLICPTGLYQWFEGKLDGYNAGGSAYAGFDNGTHSRFHLMQIQNTTNGGFITNDYNLYDQIQISNVPVGSAIGSFNDSYSSFYDISANTVGELFSINGSNHFVINRFFGSNVTAQGIELTAIFGDNFNNVFSQVTMHGVGGGGGFPIFTNYATAGRNAANNTFAHMTILNSSPQAGKPVFNIGAPTGLTHNNTYQDIVIANTVNNLNLIELNNANNEALYDLTLQGSVGSTATGILNVGNSSTNINIDGKIRITGNATNCSNSVASVKFDNTCHYGPTLAKTALTSGFDLSSSFQGAVSSDPVNQSAGGIGLQPWAVPPSASAVDWVNFLDPLYRGWGHDGVGVFTDPSRRNNCYNTINCRMYDTRLSQSDAYALNSYGAWNSALPNCPISVDGAGDTYPVGGPNPSLINDGVHIYLKNAVEIQFDDAPGANNNGLCESGEKCIYAPNAGAYQGEGDFTTQTCIFHDGPNDGAHVRGVTMYAYPNNGI